MDCPCYAGTRHAYRRRSPKGKVVEPTIGLLGLRISQRENSVTFRGSGQAPLRPRRALGRRRRAVLGASFQREQFIKPGNHLIPAHI